MLYHRYSLKLIYIWLKNNDCLSGYSSCISFYDFAPFSDSINANAFTSFFFYIQHHCHHARIVLREHLEDIWHFGIMFLTVARMEAFKMSNAMLTLVTVGAST